MNYVIVCTFVVVFILLIIVIKGLKTIEKDLEWLDCYMRSNFITIQTKLDSLQNDNEVIDHNLHKIIVNINELKEKQQ